MVIPFSLGEVEIFPLKPVGGMVAWASLVLNHSLYLGSIGVHTRPQGGLLRLVYPERILPNGRKVHVFHPINRQTGDLFEQAITEKVLSIR